MADPLLGGVPSGGKRAGSAGFISRCVVDVETERQLLLLLANADVQGLNAARDAVKAKMQEIVRRAGPLVPDDPQTSGLLKDTLRAYASRSRTRHRVMGGVVAGGKLLEQRLGKRKYSAWALTQHEDLTLRHTRGGPKYIERPFLEVVARVPDAVAEALGYTEIARAGY